MSLHDKILNIRTEVDAHDEFPDQHSAYGAGHRDARHAAAELAVKQDALVGQLVGALRDAWGTLHNLSVDMAAGPIRQQMQRRANSIRALFDSIEQADDVLTLARTNGVGK